ncbi:MAG TPA: phosphate ABC transporter substrate-binding protein PstS [Candidatus Eremiobacteraceae bacterium]|nr:phosphate ABC transporter substrate-binding protein PstS [Candidatus Eremiobacteraceae bacterium]
MHNRPLMFFAGALASITLALPVAACADAQLVGAGSSFDYPFFSRAFFQYSEAHNGVSVDYQSIGSGAGIQQFTAKTVDFGASDVPMNAKELAAASSSNGDVVQVPVALGGEAIAYNVPGAPADLHLTPDVLVAIFAGSITNWNDKAIAQLNPRANLPNLPIITVHRADGSGTTYIFTDYLSHVSNSWKSQFGTGKSVNWPGAASLGAKGNEGVAGQVRNNPGAIGYVELSYAIENGMTYAAIKNKSGAFVLPTLESVRAAAAQKATVNPGDFSIVDMNGATSYPICGYSWVILWKHQPDATKGKALVDLFNWMVSSGQSYAARLHYVPLPTSVQNAARKSLAAIR